MKTLNTLLLSLLIVGLTSCSKERTPEPVTPHALTYAVTCKACLVYFEDNTWNRTNHTPGRSDNVSQHINVYGSWTTNFEVSTLDTASLRVYVGSFGPDQSVRLYISDSKGTTIDKTVNMGVDNSEVFTELILKK